MYVCVCMAVTERQVHQAAHNGATTLKDLRRELGIVNECGNCAGCARKCLTEARRSVTESAALATACI